tara:strand:- start:309 stop:1658 length:1350 start_codon:yes stop_codon:yes gene_type:complete
MSNEWHVKYKPNKLEQTCLSFNTIDLMRKWIKEYKTINRPLFIHGNTGIGKTLIAQLLLEEFNYDIVNLNISDMRDSKMIKNIFKQSLSYSNVLQMMRQETLKKAIFIDEIDTLISLGDKKTITNVLDILKSYADKKKNNKMEYPIILTASNIKDKKITALRKYVIDAKIYKPNNYTMEKIIDRIYNKEKIKIDVDAKMLVIKNTESDIRTLVTILYELYMKYGKKRITYEKIEKFFEHFDKKKVDIDIYDSSHRTLIKRLETDELLSFFETDKLLFPLLIHENLHKAVNTKEIDSKRKIRLLDECMDIITINDTLQQKMFDEQKWQLFPISGFYSTVYPNRLLSNYKNKSNKKFSMDFSKILNKMSTFFTNQKGLLNLLRDKKDILYITEFLQYYKNKKDIDNIVNTINNNNLNVEYLDLLMRTNCFDTKKSTINAKIKKKLKKNKLK